ncbi:hypothetical protein ACFXHA_45110 [Nocardia sp. NPDC059240]|uniref:hypothetical protein n=1 Tax=Nocardia sp. NPDC059240 TaxID=3346786 RepID=UPI0036B3233F
MSDHHRAEAERMIRQAEGADTHAAAGLAGIATARALLAVEARLGQIAEHLADATRTGRAGFALHASVTDYAPERLGWAARAHVTALVNEIVTPAAKEENPR